MSMKQPTRRRTPHRRPRRYPLLPGSILLLLVVVVLVYQNVQLFSDSRDLELSTGGQTTESEFGARPPSSSEPQPVETTTAPSTAEPEPVRFQITAVGDLLMHKPVSQGARVTDDGHVATYDFRPNFEYIKRSVQDSAIAVFNLETTLAGPPYSGYPLFSAPDEIGEGMLATGFNVASTANNHIFDKGVDGFLRTTRVLQEQGLNVIGTRLSETDPRDVIFDIEGVQVGLSAYTFETPGSPQQRTLNSLPLPSEIVPLLNSFNPYRPEAFAADLERMASHVASMQERGADFICLIMHWGEEYQNVSRPYQREMAQYLADAGVDLIIGHHPHVIQEIDVVNSSLDGSPTLVYYSLGNLVTNMTTEIPGLDGRSQDGIIARVSLIARQGQVEIEKAEYIPYHIIQEPNAFGRRHLPIPVLQAIGQPDEFPGSAATYADSLRRIEDVVEPMPDHLPFPVIQSAG